MKRDDERPDRRLMRRDEARETREEDERAPEGEGLFLFLQTKDASVILPYHYEFAAALVPGPDGLQ